MLNSVKPTVGVCESGVEAPVDGVKEKVRQREGQAGVRVDQVAVGHKEVHVLPQGTLAAKAGTLHRPRVRRLAGRCDGVRVHGNGHS